MRAPPYAGAVLPIETRDPRAYRPPTMRIAQTAGRPSRRRPMLLALVFGVVLVLVGVTASALAALVSAHLSSARLNSVVANDAALVGFFVNDKLLASDVDDDGPTAARAATLSGELGHLIGDGGIVRIEIRNPDGRVIASDDLAAVGQRAAASAGATAALAGRPRRGADRRRRCRSRRSATHSVPRASSRSTCPSSRMAASRSRSSASGATPRPSWPAWTKPGATSCSSPSPPARCWPACCCSSSDRRRRG